MLPENRNYDIYSILTLRMLSVGMNFSGVFIVDRIFGNAESALYQNMVNIFLVTASLSAIGMNQGIVHLYHSASDKNYTLSLYAKYSTIISFILFFSIFLFLTLYNNSIFYYAFGVYISFAIIYSSIKKVRGHLKSAVFLENVVPYLVLIAAILVSYLLGHRNSFQESFYPTLAIFSILTSSILLFLLASELPNFLIRKIDIQAYASLLKDRGIPNFFNIGLSILLNKTEIFILIALGMTEQAGWFVKAFLIANICSLPIIFMSSFFFPNFAKLMADSKFEKARVFYLGCRNKIFAGTLFMSFVSVLLMFGYFQILGYVRIETVWVVAIVVLGCLFTASLGDFHHGLVGMGKEKYCAYTNLAAVIVNVIAGFLLIINFGEIGAAVSILLTHITKSVLGRLFLTHTGLFLRRLKES